MANEDYGLLLSVRIDNKLKKALKEQGRKEDLTLTQVVRKALREYLQRAAKEKS